MRWARVNENEYVNEDQIRGLQFVKKSEDNFYYRILYNGGASTDVRGFVSFEDAFDSANSIFKLDNKVETIKSPEPVKVKAKK